MMRLSLAALLVVPLFASAQTPEIQQDVDARLHALRTAAPLIASAPAARIAMDEAAVAALTAQIDKHLVTFWAQNNIRPAARADDAEFLRRVSLDLIGRIPSIQEVRQFQADANPRKRERKVADLLNQPAFLRHYASVLRQQWVPQTIDNQQLQRVGVDFENWLRGRLKDQRGLDTIVRDVLTAPTLFARNAEGLIDQAELNRTAYGFNQANEFKPENVAASASRLFLGIKMECAQCHDHPCAAISRDQFWETAAFFAELQPVVANLNDVKLKREIRIVDNDPKKVKTVQAQFFDETQPVWKEGVSPRAVFVDWLVSPSNRYFARNAVQRTWADFFGLGFIDPIDEPGLENPELIPALLDDMSHAFAANGYDQRFLIRAIVRSRAYQLTSRQTDIAQANPRHFARMNVKALTPEQLYDSLAQATGFKQGNSDNPDGSRRDFLLKFNNTGKITERQTSILQALTMMNGRLVADQTSLERSQFLAGIADAPFLDAEAQVEIMFLASLSRQPTADESSRFSSHVQRNTTAADRKKALTDVFWALLNSTEFILNH